MPGQTGISAMGMLRAREAATGRRRAVCILSSADDSSYEPWPGRRPPDAVLTKPFPPEALAKQLLRFFPARKII